MRGIIYTVRRDGRGETMKLHPDEHSLGILVGLQYSVVKQKNVS